MHPAKASQPLPFLKRIHAAAALFLGLATATLHAGGPRWVTGPPFFSTQGVPVVWYTNQPLYFTDPGDLSPTVNHAAADAIVASAASVWTVPTSSLVLAYGGALDEHVSGANTYAGSNGLILPSDVQAGNYASKQIAVIYDSDGSVTDLLLGNGASDPTSCRQNAVTESVDSIVPAGFIQHAILVLNGRCTGPAPEQQLQLQYQLMRAFGRVLGLGWSQTNDNVFTGSPQPTFGQALNWPIMHPIDIICGPYTYQCLPQPFTLRVDDLSALALLYFIPQGQAPPGKTDSLLRANRIEGALLFPTGQRMEGVNVVGRRWQQYTGTPEGWYSVSSVSGYLFKGTNGNPVTGPVSTAAQSMGSSGGANEGYFNLERVPMLDGDWQNVILDTEPINPLYTGQYAVGPYTDNVVEPSGADVPALAYVLASYSDSFGVLSTTDAASSCDTSADGTESAPAVITSTGWWSGLLCAYGHTAWSNLAVKGNRTFTIEVTAQDEQGFATTAKTLPAIGVWNATAPLGSLPGVAATTEAFNSAATGTSAVTVQNTQPNTLRIAITDQRGDGRPDFAYRARMLYADNITPANVSATGGTVTITGMGFRPGNVVTVNGVLATVSNWTATTIVATVPTLHSLGSTTALTADIAVTDLSTGGTTIMTGALSYSPPAPTPTLITAPTGTVALGQPATVPFAVQVLAGDGLTPIVGESVTFTATTGAAQFAPCGTPVCTLVTNSSGVASVTVTPHSLGAITLQAAGVDGSVSASFTSATQLRTITPVRPVEYIATNAAVAWTPQVTLADNLSPTTGVAVQWQPLSGPVQLSPSQSQANSQSIAQTLATAGPLAASTQSVISACAWTVICTNLITQAVDPAALRLQIVSGAGQTVTASETLAPIVLLVTDDSAHPVAGAVVQIHQTVDAWQIPCPDHGRCPVPPIYGSSVSSITSDDDGLLTITPMQSANAAEVTNVAAATGTQGFISLALQKQP